MNKSEVTTTMLKMGIMAALVVVAMPELAGAADNLSGSVAAIGTGIKDIPGVVSGLAYIIGAVLVVSGALSLKKHSENPAGEPMGKGIGRLVAGAGVIALPGLANWLRSSAGFGANEDLSYNALSAV